MFELRFSGHLSEVIVGFHIAEESCTSTQRFRVSVVSAQILPFYVEGFINMFDLKHFNLS